MPSLSNDLLQRGATSVALPAYDRSALTVGIVHFGVGGFHRAHQAMYLDRLMNDGLALDWGICGVGVMPADKAMAEALRPQDGLYTLLVKHPDGHVEPRAIGSIVEVVYAPEAPQRVLDVLVSESTRIVSLTITEGGYNFNQATHEFIADDPAIQADLTPEAPPSTVFGYVIEALRRRRSLGRPPFTIMSCDNVPSNGDMARRTFTAFATLKDPDLAEWISANVCFPNSMVDRITPVTIDADARQLTDEFGIEDNWPVVCEPFTQWVLEDRFGAGRPPLEQAGVQLVPDVEPYEQMKLHLLNAGHQALSYFGVLLGHRYVHQAAADPRIVGYLRAYMDREATPVLPPVPGIDLDQYKDELVHRFSNPEIQDTLARVCMDSSDRIPKWVLPVLRRNLAGGGPITNTTAIVASWARYAEGADDNGRPIEVVDRLAAQVTAAVRQYADDPLALPRLRQLFGDLIDDARFCDTYLKILDNLHRLGAAGTLDRLATEAD